MSTVNGREHHDPMQPEQPMSAAVKTEYEITKEDPLYPQALETVHKTKRTSVSYLQRVIRIGYYRAARMLEAMEKDGVVSSYESNGGRKYLGG